MRAFRNSRKQDVPVALFAHNHGTHGQFQKNDVSVEANADVKSVEFAEPVTGEAVRRAKQHRRNKSGGR